LSKHDAKHTPAARFVRFFVHQLECGLREFFFLEILSRSFVFVFTQERRKVLLVLCAFFVPPFECGSYEFFLVLEILPHSFLFHAARFVRFLVHQPECGLRELF